MIRFFEVMGPKILFFATIGGIIATLIGFALAAPIEPTNLIAGTISLVTLVALSIVLVSYLGNQKANKCPNPADYGFSSGVLTAVAVLVYPITWYYPTIVTWSAEQPLIAIPILLVLGTASLAFSIRQLNGYLKARTQITLPLRVRR